LRGIRAADGQPAGPAVARQKAGPGGAQNPSTRPARRRRPRRAAACSQQARWVEAASLRQASLTGGENTPGSDEKPQAGLAEFLATADALRSRQGRARIASRLRRRPRRSELERPIALFGPPKPNSGEAAEQMPSAAGFERLRTRGALGEYFDPSFGRSFFLFKSGDRASRGEPLRTEIFQSPGWSN